MQRRVAVRATLAALAAIGLVAYAGLWVRGERARDETVRAFEARWGTLEDVVRTHDGIREANASALRVEVLAARLGIDVVPRGRAEPREQPGPRRAEAWQAVKDDVGTYVARLVGLDHEALEVPPPPVSLFLSDCGADLAALREHLVAAPIPAWERGLDRGHEAPIPNLLGLIDVTRLLAADAAARGARGDRAGALRNLDALWRLNESLRDDPVLISQLISVAIGRIEAGLLRQFPDAGPEWTERFSGFDARGRLERALAWENRMLLAVANARPERDAPWLERALGALQRPLQRLWVAETSRALSREIEDLAGLESLCDPRLDDLAHAVEALPWWNPLGDVLLPNLGTTPSRFARAEVDLELTRRVLERRAAGAAAEAARTIVTFPSAVCPNKRWTESPGADGSVTIALDPTAGWPDGIGAEPAASFRIR